VKTRRGALASVGVAANGFWLKRKLKFYKLAPLRVFERAS
jgi:hypothetical protein